MHCFLLKNQVLFVTVLAATFVVFAAFVIAFAFLAFFVFAVAFMLAALMLFATFVIAFTFVTFAMLAFAFSLVLAAFVFLAFGFHGVCHLDVFLCHLDEVGALCFVKVFPVGEGVEHYVDVCHHLRTWSRHLMFVALLLFAFAAVFLFFVFLFVAA